MQFIFFVCTDPSAPEYNAAEDNIEEWVAEMDARGVHEGGNRIRPPADAKTVVVRGGEVRVTDGPFAETKEWIAGYDLIDCAGLDEAIEIAAKHPMARFGKIEVRAAWPMG
ncbi:YciI family protein [Subtercola lobariae]|uniref:Transcription initiation protein n=1 Tax=Subtercola lobariae TaxID=1588641 RepID=A0A917B2Y2_9MICO|nr:YciI family protein [Subtercola lobariae]GGF14753.1 transcription initiation protein [Subtercola lobariae]